MRVKLLLLGIAFFVIILDKSDAINKRCYRAKICIHDGKEKCGQDLTGKVRRFLDSCDIKEYNCLKNANFQKTNAKNCQNLSSIEKKLSADDKVKDKNDADDGNKNEGGVNEFKNDDETNGASNVDVDLRDSKETKYDGTSQKVGANNGNGIDSESEEDVPIGESKVDDEVNREEKKHESGKENTRESQEDGANRASKEDETDEANKEQTDDTDHVNELVGENEMDSANEANKGDEVYKDNIVNKSKGDDSDDEADQASKVDKTDEASKDSNQDNEAEKLYYGPQLENVGTTDEAD